MAQQPEGLVGEPATLPPHNLPAELTGLVGRNSEIAEVQRLLAVGRAVTITGVPGVGKTRLAREAARGVLDRFPDGVWLADLTGSALAADAVIAGAWGLSAPNAGPGALRGAAKSTLEVISDWVAGRELLLILDGAERDAVAVARAVTSLLAAAPRLRILTTSQMPLGVSGEFVWQLSPLALPGADDSAAVVIASPAVLLFADRARHADPGFTVSAENVSHVVDICRRLDGIPLAIELAASRIAAIGIGDLAARLDTSLDLVTAANGASRRHHQTLQAALDWGYQLLRADEQLLFDRLAVFRGEFSLEAVESVGTAAPLAQKSILDLMSSLVAKSMVLTTTTGTTIRYRMSEGLRTFAAGGLEEREETARVRERHMVYFFDLVERQVPALRASTQIASLAALEEVHVDLLHALDWAVTSGNAAAAHGFVAGLYLFWFAHRHTNLQPVVEEALATPGPVDAEVRARSLVGAGLLAVIAGDFELGAAHLDAGDTIAAAAGAAGILGESKLYRGLLAQQRGRVDDAEAQFASALDLFEESGEAWGVAWATWFLGSAAFERGADGTAEGLVKAALASFRLVESSFGIANSLSILGILARRGGHTDRAIRYHTEGLDLFRDIGDRNGTAALHASLGLDNRAADRPGDAVDHFGAAVAIARDLGNEPWLCELLYLLGDSLLSGASVDEATARLNECIELARTVDDAQAAGAAKLALSALALCEHHRGRLGRTVTLLAAVDNLDYIDAEEFFAASTGSEEDALTQARARLGTQVYEAAWNAGHTMTLPDAIGYALSEADRDIGFGEPVGLSLQDIELGERVTQQLEGVGERRELRVAGIRLAGRRRRPTGEGAPLPRELQASGIFWLITGLIVSGLWVTLFAWPETRDWWEMRDLAVNRWFADLRTEAVTDIAEVVGTIASPWVFRPTRWIILLAIVAFKRWRHLLAAVGVFVVTDVVVDSMRTAIERPRPFVEILDTWAGYSHPAAPVAAVAVTLVGAGYSLLPAGRWRRRWMIGAGSLIVLFVVTRVYTGVDHLTDGVVGAMFGAAMGVVVFRLFVPDKVFPVSYAAGPKAHLDIDEARATAIRRAVADQLGMQVIDVTPFGTAASGGSTPLRLTIGGSGDTHLFAKLYSQTHLRSDRWYKAGRTILYGSLEDEVRFESVRRLVEYEDYMLLAMQKAGVPSAIPHGVVEITPEREYLIVTEFLRDADEITDAPVDEAVVDDALLMIRRLWDAGVAHRDIKPANVMVRDGQIRLIDVAFATIRPSPWRQAVDLANMMIILALCTNAELVYERALRYFAPEDIAEAFAATRGITVPTQSRSLLRMAARGAGTDIVARFRELAPPRERISIQRWSARRIALTLWAGFVVAALASLIIQDLSSGGFL